MNRVDALEPAADDLSDNASGTWTVVCSVDSVAPDRGVAVLIDDVPIAIFRLASADGPGQEPEKEEWCGISHIDPFSGAPVMARGLIGSVGEAPMMIPTVASPLLKQRFNLRTGFCLDDGNIKIETYPVRANEGSVEVMTQITRL